MALSMFYDKMELIKFEIIIMITRVIIVFIRVTGS